MKPLDPLRYIAAELVDAAHKLPLPNGRLFGVNGETPGKEMVDTFDPFVAMLFAGGSIRAVAQLAPKPAPAL